jgi:hypothetical protein
MGFATTAAIIGAVASAAGAGVTASQANRANKEAKRQKAIAAEEQRKQDKLVAEELKKAEAEEQKLLEQHRARVSADQVQKRRNRGKRSLIYGSETGIEDEDLG